MDYRLITQQADFDGLCEHLKGLPFFTLDTEFVRTRTLQPQLGLLQVSDGDKAYLIDPLTMSNFTLFTELLTDLNVVKVLHACSEDLEVFLAHMGVIPKPIFDTQYAANLLGMGASLGYGPLVELQCEVTLDKGESRTDWLARPLSANQLQYAANDVIYLHHVYQKLASSIDQQNLRSMVYAEMEALGAKKSAVMPEEYAYLLISNNWKLNARQRYVLKQLAAWRLRCARERDSAINFIVKEAHLFALALYLPKTKAQLIPRCGLLPQEVRKQGDTLIEIIHQATAEYDEHPQRCEVPEIKRLNDVPHYKKSLSQLKLLCEQIASENQLTMTVAASKKQLNQLLKWWWFPIEETSVQGLLPDLLMGWRYPLFVDRLKALLGTPVRSLD